MAFIIKDRNYRKKKQTFALIDPTKFRLEFVV